MTRRPKLGQFLWPNFCDEKQNQISKCKDFQIIRQNKECLSFIYKDDVYKIFVTFLINIDQFSVNLIQFFFRRRGMTEQSKSNHSKYAYFKDEQYIQRLQEIKSKYDNVGQNSYGCYVKPNPRLFPFHVYWKCVGEFSYIVLYFPYLVLTLALILVLLERILTRYLWTGQRIEKFYNLLVKEVIECGDIDKVDTKENR